MHPDLAALLSSTPARLSYSIHSVSGYNSAYPPEKVLVDRPADDSSRWTTPTPEERRKERKACAAAHSPPVSAAPNARVPLEKGESEWIIIELDQVSFVRHVGFSKTTKAHPCNLAEFSISGGLSADPLTMEPLVRTASLKNDANPEKFPLPVEVQDGARESAAFPVKYLKIDCHEAANASYSVSIWHIFLEGHLLLPPLDSLALESLTHHKETTTAHLVLAHLRRSGPDSLATFDSYFSSLPASISNTFEHPELSNLYRALVLEGDFERSERVLEQCLSADLFSEWSSTTASSSTARRGDVKKGKTVAKWERLDTLFPGGGRAPGPRGGHQMVRVGRKLLMFGGWDGSRDLGDLWEWELPRAAGHEDGTTTTGGEGGWRCISTGEADDGAESGRPGKRSCHQLAVDENEGWVYLLGARRDDDVPQDWEERVPEPEPTSNGADAMDVERDDTETRGRTRPSARNPGDRWQSDFWRYKAVGPGKGKWELLSRDTRMDGGPALLFDHAMVVHSATQRLFVFGGKWQPYEGGETDELNRADTASAFPSQYSGMYCYDINAKKWTHLLGDPATSSTPASFLADRLVPRAGHSMVLDPTARNATIYIYGGQRDTRYENDLWAVRLATPRPSDGNFEDDSHDDGAQGEEDRLWRQGAVLDAPRRAVARSLIDASLLPVSPESSPSRNSSSTPTIVQIRRITAKDEVDSVVPPSAFTPRISLAANRSLTLVTGLTRTGTGSAMEEVPLEGIWRKSQGDSGPWEQIEEWSAGSGRDDERRPRKRFASQVRRLRPISVPHLLIRIFGQVVFDPLRSEHYLFGGHPHDTANPETRLSDFWKLRIIDPTPQEALRMTKFLVRKQKFNEMCTTVPTVFALQYLQNDLSSVVDHSSPSESTAFRSCMTALLSAPPQHNVDMPLDGSGELPRLDGTPARERLEYRRRHELFEELMEFFPRGERQPVERLDQIGRLLRGAKK
ncbi:hypothetical protein JCM11491_000250 [Sporobolomyces phaffii]